MPRWATRQQTVSTHPLVRKSPIYTPFPTSSIPTRVIRSSHYSQASGLLVTKSINLSDRTIIHQHSTTQHSVTRHRPRNNMTMTPLRPASDNRSGFPPVRVLRNNFTDYVTQKTKEQNNHHRKLFNNRNCVVRSNKTCCCSTTTTTNTV